MLKKNNKIILILPNCPFRRAFHGSLDEAKLVDVKLESGKAPLSDP